jgi:hypothetical protein
MRRTLLVGICAVVATLVWLSPWGAGGTSVAVSHRAAAPEVPVFAADTVAYRAALPVDVKTRGKVYNCTSGYLFRAGGSWLGSTAGHCGRPGDRVRSGGTTIGVVSVNTFESDTRQVRADIALYPVAGHGEPAVDHEDGPYREVVGALHDDEIGIGDVLCFDGRASGPDACGFVNAVDRVICCDATGRSFVFSCIGHPALAGDSGAPIYRPLGRHAVLAVGVLSSSVRVDGVPSTCFSTIDQIEERTGASLVIG